MRRTRILSGALIALVVTAGLLRLAPARAACCYFSALGSDVNQPSQKAFLTWNPAERIESFTVQPRFEGNAADFGMVIPTPSRPRLNEMPRDFFKELAVFTILKPMPLDKYKRHSIEVVVDRGKPGTQTRDFGIDFPEVNSHERRSRGCCSRFRGRRRPSAPIKAIGPGKPIPGPMTTNDLPEGRGEGSH